MNAHNNLIDSIFEILRKIILRGGIGPVIPAIIFLLFFFAMPLVVLCAFGFVSIDRGVVDWTSISLDHLTSTIKDTLFWHFWWRSFWVGTVSTIFCLCLGYPVAYIYTLAGRGWQILILVATISPLLTSALVRTYAWMVILGGRRGVVNSILLDLDFIDRPIRFLYSDFSVILGMTQIHLPFMILPLITVLSARDFSLEQASLNLGASRLKTFFKIIVPISLPGIIAGFALVFAISYTNFIVPQLLGGGNYTTLAVQVYEFIVVILDWNKGAILAFLLLTSCFFFVLGINYIGNWAMKWKEVTR